MKAKDYYEKYKFVMELEVKEDVMRVCTNLLNDFTDDFNEIRKQRNISTIDGVAALVKELNNKFNAIARLFIKEYGQSPFQIDGYKEVILIKVPELKGKL